jgi:hypothetical protein
MARRIRITNLKVAAAVASVAVAGLLLGAQPAQGAATPASWCTASELSWNGSAQLGPEQLTFDTGLVVAPAVAGETVRIVDTAYVAYDEVAPELDRSAPPEVAERFGLDVGGSAVGGFSVDLPDDVGSGAISTWSSGDHAGSLGGGPTTGGPVALRHVASTGGGSADRLTVSSLRITVERCAVVAVAPTPASRLTVPAAAAPVTPGAVPTGPAGASGATGALPATGVATWPMVLVGFTMMATGAALVVAGGSRRRA